ncbi:hypothetical protein CHLNCDRAFT_19370 [Chlorella variabilis]|uniref:Uncharacterized protein n=1 Tax=Chlorella variabilis TaxID=554065 RepID=E1Z5B7_CHLVA|nr:hypothetical protein CHLNCDRAFT_19370 [Chlorella variabilis]EFN59201.1 hypothetical protein CHLNCDRAFT_19370 [Chlorella variabilis]|eukprot:XP_005851303.1 hypothetical protein CHLNCDRAFT_19370 [Chlorella variabilis]
MGSDPGQPGGRWTYKETAWCGRCRRRQLCRWPFNRPAQAYAPPGITSTRCRLTEGHRQPIYCGAFNHFSHQLGDLLATVGGCRATIYACQPGGELEVLQVFCDADSSEEFYACCWSLDCDSGAPLLLLAGKSGQLVVVNALTGTLDTCLEGHGSSINDVAAHPTRPQFVATASRDHSLRLWNLRTRRGGGCCVLLFQGDGGHRNEVLTLSWKAGADSLLLSAGMDNHTKIWSLAQHQHTLDASDEWRPGGPRSFPTGRVTMPIFSTERVHWNYVDCVRWLGDFVLSKSVDNCVLGWRPDRTTRQHEQDGDVQLVQARGLAECANVWWLRFALDYWCTVLACGTSTGKVLLFDPHAQQPQPRARLKPRRCAAKGERAPLVRQTAVSYDGSIVVACHEDGSLTR